MSPSDPAGPRGESVLIARGGPGVEIQVVDTDYQVRGHGTEEVRLDLPEGIYFVDWISGGETTQKLVRLLPIEEPLVVSLDLPGEASADATISETAQSRDHVAELVTSKLQPSERSYGSSIAVVIQTDDAEIGAKVGAEIRLLNSRDVARRANDRDLSELQAVGGFALHSYRVRPGQFHLRFLTSSGETLDQTIPAIEGRRTVVVMRARAENVLIAEEGSFRTEERHGIDPMQTVLFSVPAGSPASALSEGARLAAILIHDLASGGGSLGQAFVQTLDADDADPLLQIYGALVIIARLEQNASPALDEPWPADAEAQDAFRARWLGKAAEWLISLRAKGLPSDVAAAGWRLKELGVDTSGPSVMKRPPMFECSWRWTVAHSVTDRRAVPMTASLRAAARSAGGTSPWLCWRAAAAKAKVMPPPKEHGGDIPALIDALSTLAREFIDTASAEPNGPAGDPLALLSPDARLTALRSIEASERGPAGASAGQYAEPAAELAASFGMPAPQLEGRLVRTIAEIAGVDVSAAAAAAMPSSGPAESADEPGPDEQGPPALQRMLESADDPNKGRFGRRSERGGFQLTAEFKMANSQDWVRISLAVEADRPVSDGTKVEFYLHDSFRPAKIESQFRGRRAGLQVTSWGGFTVGVWIPSERVELELDLAHHPDAPKIVKTR